MSLLNAQWFGILLRYSAPCRTAIMEWLVLMAYVAQMVETACCTLYQLVGYGVFYLSALRVHGSRADSCFRPKVCQTQRRISTRNRLRTTSFCFVKIAIIYLTSISSTKADKGQKRYLGKDTKHKN